MALFEVGANSICILWTGTKTKGYGVIDISIGPIKQDCKQMPVQVYYFSGIISGIISLVSRGF